jgi:hypothetical protein
MNLLFNKLYAAPDSGGSGGATAPEETETFELLNAEEEPEVLDLPKTEKKEGEEDEESEDKTTGEEEEGDELKEIEKELEAPTEEDIDELITPVRRKEILTKYPKLFKDFPYLEKAYYREQQFTEVYPTIQDARVAADKAAILDRTEREVMNGNIGSILSAAKQENQEIFNRIADNYLPTLRAVDQQAYYHVLSGVIKDTIVTMVREGRALGEQGAPLQAAANVLNQFVFGSQNFQPHHPLSRQVRPEEQRREYEFQQQENNRMMSQFTSVKDDLQTKADNVLKSTIDGHIDPRGTMTDYVKQHATQEAFNNLEDLLAKDMRFRSLLDKLWEKAFESGFDKTTTDKIKAAYLSKAKTLLPSVIKKARNDALRGRSNREEIEEETTTSKKGPITPGRSTAPSSGKIRKPSDIPKGMSTLDVLMKD